MSAIPKDIAALDAAIGERARRVLQGEENRLTKQLKVPESVVEEMIAEALKLLIQAKYTFNPEKGEWNGYAYEVLRRHFYHNSRLYPKLKQQLQTEVFVDTTNPSESRFLEAKPRVVDEKTKRNLALQVSRVMERLEPPLRQIAADSVICTTRATASRNEISSVAVKRKINMLRQVFEQEGFGPDDVA
jgi:DNA-directed RNA polymerase specialized sigma24 family protein